MYHVIVDKYHAGRSNRSMLRHVIMTRPCARESKGGFAGWMRQDRQLRHAFLRGVLQAHEANRAIYRAVVGGTL